MDELFISNVFSCSDATQKLASNKKKSSLKMRKGGREEDSGKNLDEETSVSLDRDDNGHSKNPFHRAKKHIKTFICNKLFHKKVGSPPISCTLSVILSFQLGVSRSKKSMKQCYWKVKRARQKMPTR